MKLGWSPGTGQEHGKWKCMACDDEPAFMTLYNARRHNGSEKHTNATKRKLRLAAAAQEASSSRTAPPTDLDVLTAVAAASCVHGPWAELLGEVSDEEYAPELGDAGPSTATHYTSGGWDAEGGRDEWVLDWDAVSSELRGELAPSAAHRSVTSLASSLADWLASGDTGLNSGSSAEEEPTEDEGPLTYMAPGEYNGVPSSKYCS